MHHLMGFKIFIYFVLYFYLVTVLQAREIENLYEARVLLNAVTQPEVIKPEEVKTQEQKIKDENLDQKLLIDRVLVKVLNKVTGTNAFLTSANLKEIMSQSESLVQKFSFQNEIDSDDKLATVATIVKENSVENSLKKTWFWARFSKYDTDNLLKKHQLPIWGSFRPDTLIWLSIERDHKREIISPSTDSLLVKQLNYSAEQRGIALVFPFADLEDQEKLSTTDLWGNYSQVIKAASIRYSTQAILAIRVHQEPSGLWLAKWSLYVLDKVESWNNKDENISTLLAQGINSLADRLATFFAISSDSLSQNSSIIQVNNVTNFAGFLVVEDYFKHISAIQSTDLIQVKNDSISFKVNYMGDEKHLAQSLALGDILQKVGKSSDLADNKGDNKSLEYVSVILDKPVLKSNKQGLNKPLVNKQESGKIVVEAADKKVNQYALPKVQINESNNNHGITEPQIKLEEPQIKSQNIQPDLEFWLAR